MNLRPDELEKLAEAAHAVQHSCLVPYAELAEADKARFRDLVRGNPAILEKTGYVIVSRDFMPPNYPR